jgi:argininosuccinate lyase
MNRGGPETDLLAAVQQLDDRLSLHGPPLERGLLLPLNEYDKAHTVMLVDQSLISGEDATRILAALRRVDDMGVAGFPWGKGDLWSLKERFVVNEIGADAGGRLHTGRSRVDVTSTAERLYLRQKLLSLFDGASDCADALTELAQRHVRTVMPCYTYGQQAQPTTFGHYSISYVFALLRRLDGIQRCYTVTNQSPAGAALQVGTSHAIDRQAVQRLLGFDSVIWNTRDAALSVDHLNDTAIACGLLVGDLVKLFEDLTVWHSAEFGMIALDTTWYGMSSLMPQKRNPYPFMLLRGKAARILTRCAHAFNTLESPTLGPPLPSYRFAEIDGIVDETVGFLAIATGVLKSLQVAVAVMAESAAKRWAQAADLADLIVQRRGISFRTAHRLVALLVHDSVEKGISPLEISGEQLDSVAGSVLGRRLELTDEDLKDALDPQRAVERRVVYGGTAEADVTRQITYCRDELERQREWAGQRRSGIVEAGNALRMAMTRVAGETGTDTR